MGRDIKKIVLLVFFAALAVTLAPPVFCQSDADSASLLQGATLTEKEGLLVLHLKGTPYQMGYQHGALLKDHIKVLYNDYLLGSLKTKVKSKKRFEAALNYFQTKARVLEKYIPEPYLQEIRGIADGSGFPYIDILVIHTFLDVISNHRLFNRDFKSCTNFVSLNSASLNRELIHGRNLSWPSRGILNKQAVVMFYQPKEGNSFVALAWPGVCGVLTGMNDKGITLGETSVGTAESTLEGIPAFILLRQALEKSDTLYDAIRLIASSQRTTGYTVVLSDGKLNKACVIEFTAQHYTVRMADKDFVVSTNHFQDPVLQETMKPVYPGRKLEDSSSYERLVRINELINANMGKIDSGLARNFLRDKVLLTKGALLSVVFLPGELKFLFANGRETIAEDKFVAFDLKEELGVNKAFPGQFPDPQDYYGYDKKEILAEMHLISKTANYKKYKITYDGVIKNGFSDNKIYLTYYEPANAQNCPAVLVIPHTAGGSQQIEGQFCENLVEDGIAALLINMSYQEKTKEGHKWLREQLKKADLEKIDLLLKQLVVESRRALDWLETQPGLDNQRLGIMGVSLGAVVSPIVTGLEPRLHSAMYLLGGGDLSNIIYKGDELLYLRDRLLKKKIPPEEFEREHAAVDPLTFAFKAKDTPTVMCNSMFDTVIPRQSTVELWQALNRPKLYWVPAAHYTAVLFIGNTKSIMAEHFNSTLGKRLAQKLAGLRVQAGEHVQLSKENFLNQNFRVTASAKYDTHEQRIKVGLLKEDFLSSPFFAGFDISGMRDKDTRYSLKGMGRDVYAGLKVSKKIKFTLKFHNQDISMKKVSKAAPEILRYSSGRSQVSNWDFLFERSTLDDRYYPRKGTFHSLEWDVAAKRMASNYSFNRITWQSRGYWTPGNFFTFMARTKVGWIESYGKTSMVPYFERFFCGGSSTIRGYRSRKVGPKDSDNLPLGGDFLWVNNFEARFPIFKKLTGACFFDAGSLWQDTGALHWNDMRYGTGVGLRYISPWGIIRADYGIRLRHDSSQPRSAYYLSFGMPF